MPQPSKTTQSPLEPIPVAILAGGKGTRMGPLTETTPKPLLPIGGIPVLCHILRHYAEAGSRRFVIATGYRGGEIAALFEGGHCRHAFSAGPEGTVTVLDTGPDTETGGRLLRLRPELGDATFMLTWGDGLSDVDLADLLAFHRGHGRLATLTAVHPPGRFGHLTLENDRVTLFEEKPEHEPGWINGAYFVLEPGVFDYIHSGDESWERGALSRLAAAGELMAYRHEGFWRCMDTPAELEILDGLWRSGRAPWSGGTG